MHKGIGFISGRRGKFHVGSKIIISKKGKAWLLTAHCYSRYVLVMLLWLWLHCLRCCCWWLVDVVVVGVVVGVVVSLLLLLSVLLLKDRMFE